VKYPEKFAMYIDKKKKYISREMIDRKEEREERGQVWPNDADFGPAVQHDW
jgi:hypothetical protein